METEIKLISKTSYQDDIGQIIDDPSIKSVLADVVSVSRSEFFSAGNRGFNPSILIKTHTVNYNGEQIAIVDGVRYSIYRTYKNDEEDEIELYCQESNGVTNV